MPDADHSRDFDFFVGSWKVRHRRLKERMAGSTEWVEFDGTSQMQLILGGQGNIDDNHLNVPTGSYRAVTMRAFDPKSQTWSIWWLDSRTPNTLGVPVVGSFENGVGTFYSDETFNDKPIKVRFLWNHQEADRCRWEQAFSGDAGSTWETNWIMEFTKVLSSSRKPST
jgi:hypothetical protein